jgi:hypothetical protein
MPQIQKTLSQSRLTGWLPVTGMTKLVVDGDVWPGVLVAAGTDVLAGTLVCVWVAVGVEVDTPGGVLVAVLVEVN